MSIGRFLLMDLQQTTITVKQKYLSNKFVHETIAWYNRVALDACIFLLTKAHKRGNNPYACDPMGAMATSEPAPSDPTEVSCDMPARVRRYSRHPGAAVARRSQLIGAVS